MKNSESRKADIEIACSATDEPAIKFRESMFAVDLLERFEVLVDGDVRLLVSVGEGVFSIPVYCRYSLLLVQTI